MKTALVVQHQRFETLGHNFRAVLDDCGFETVTMPLFEDAPAFRTFDPPGIDAVDLLISLGGPMSANDDLPALLGEMEYLKSAAERGTPVVGICLGAQLLARALRGSVHATGGYQFGLRKLWVTEAGHGDRAFSKIAVPLVPTLHGECFSIPAGAIKLAEGFMLRRDGRYRRINMGFRFNNAYGLQFEPQLTLDELKVWNLELSSDYLLMGSQFDPAEEAARNLREFERFAETHETQMAALLRAIIDAPVG